MAGDSEGVRQTDLAPTHDRVRVGTPPANERRGSAAGGATAGRRGSAKRLSFKGAITATTTASVLFKESKGKEAKRKLSLLLKGEDREDVELDQFMRQMLREEGKQDERPWYSVRHNNKNKVSGSPAPLGQRRADHPRESSLPAAAFAGRSDGTS